MLQKSTKNNGTFKSVTFVLLLLLKIGLLHSLFQNGYDVKLWLKARVLKNFLGSDQQVVDMFNEIGTYLPPATFMTMFVVCKNKGKMKCD